MKMFDNLIFSKLKNQKSKLLLFTFFLSLLAYGFALTTHSITIDNETPINSDFGMDFGRWGQNLILYQLFNGHLPYFSLMLSLFLFTIVAVKLADLFNFRDWSSYMFCALFVTFPQVSYQFVFGMATIVASLGLLLSVISVELFIRSCDSTSNLKKYLGLVLTCLVITFIFGIYQGFVIVQILIYLIFIFNKTFQIDFKYLFEFKRLAIFTSILLISGLLYLLSVKIFCPPIENSAYLASFTQGQGSNSNLFESFYLLLKINLKGNAFYGEKLYSIATIAVMLLIFKIIFLRKHFLLRFLFLIFILIAPFLISFFITSGYHPPRLYLTANIVFAFLIISALNQFKFEDKTLSLYFVAILVVINISFITKLYIACNNIYEIDKRTAEKIDNIIQRKYSIIYNKNLHVYFYGYFPYEYHQAYRLPDSEVFGGSFYNWDNGNNFRITNFFNAANVASYKMIETKEMLEKIKSNITKSPIWPNEDSVTMIDSTTVVVKLGDKIGGKMYFE